MVAAAETKGSAPSLTCACGASIDASGVRIGDSVRCSACGRLRVVIRSKASGDVPPAEVKVGALSAEERGEVDDALHRIKQRRVGRATKHVSLYPSWAVFVAGVQFYLAAILAGQNLVALGEARRGKRVMTFGIVAYLVLGAALLAVDLLARELVPGWAMLGVMAAVPLAFAIYLTAIQHAAGAAARVAGAPSASVALPLLIGVILGIAQAFAVWFLELQSAPW